MRYTLEIRKENGDVFINLGCHDSKESAVAALDYFVERMKDPTEFLDVYINDDIHSILHPVVDSKEWWAAQ